MSADASKTICEAARNALPLSEKVATENFESGYFCTRWFFCPKDQGALGVVLINENESDFIHINNLLYLYLFSRPLLNLS